MMSEISRFYGIIVKMFPDVNAFESGHLYALYGEHIGIFDLLTTEMTEGDLPVRARTLVQEWMQQHQAALQEMWNSRNPCRLPPL